MLHTCIFLVLAWKETWEISQHSLSVGERLTFHCTLFSTFWIFSRHFFFFFFFWSWTEQGLVSFSRGIWKEKWWGAEARSHSHLPPSRRWETTASPASCWLWQQGQQWPRWGPGKLGGWERARQQMFGGTRWPTKPSSTLSFALPVWPWPNYLTSLGLLSSTVKCGENVPNRVAERVK